jgi:hypothetical protein
MIRFMIELILYAACMLLVCAGVCFGLFLWWAKSFDEHIKRQTEEREEDWG